MARRRCCEMLLLLLLRRRRIMARRRWCEVLRLAWGVLNLTLAIGRRFFAVNLAVSCDSLPGDAHAGNTVR